MKIHVVSQILFSNKSDFSVWLNNVFFPFRKELSNVISVAA